MTTVVGFVLKNVEVIAKPAAGAQRQMTAVIRTATQTDKQALVRKWKPVLNTGPTSWLDRLWTWESLDNPEELACKIDPLWLVLALDDGEILGVLVVSGPVPLRLMTEHKHEAAADTFLWVEYLAISPFIRKDCPRGTQRAERVVPIGVRLMQAAIEESAQRGAKGRIGLHAEGELAVQTYEGWQMHRIEEQARHPADGNLYSIFFGDEGWAQLFRVAASKGGS